MQGANLCVKWFIDVLQIRRVYRTPVTDVDHLLALYSMQRITLSPLQPIFAHSPIRILYYLLLWDAKRRPVIPLFVVKT
jgi:hypothetical protein